jgi:hypothetical protein
MADPIPHPHPLPHDLWESWDYAETVAEIFDVKELTSKI